MEEIENNHIHQEGIQGDTQASASSTFSSPTEPDFEKLKEERIHQLIDNLNPQQREAVTYEGPALLIAAGAGSGKTRVLTRRIAWLLIEKNIYPSQILAITFTNKAAAEMRERLQSLIGNIADRMWISTFHSACVRILRRFYEAAGLKSGFTIYDQQDSLNLIKTIENDLGIDPKNETPRSFLSFISRQKNTLTAAEPLLAQHAPDYRVGKTGQKVTSAHRRAALESIVYAEYQYRIKSFNAVDFDDIIAKTVQLLRNNEEASRFYHHQFRFILVDEYQDTNDAQYELIRELGGYGHFPSPHPASITVVGDSDQSIYAFRGADIRNIQNFETDFPQATTILLEQNYRSTQNILDAANAVISENPGRSPKRLWTSQGNGEKITGYAAENGYEEARYVASQIEKLHEQQIPYSSVAVMYRANAQSRLLEEMLVSSGIPYKVVGGMRFYERKEIKDLLGYLYIILNPSDDMNLRRILNVPKRGIGPTSEAKIAQFALDNGLSFWNALEYLDEIGIKGKALTQLKSFLGLMNSLRELCLAKDSDSPLPSDIIKIVLDKSGLVEALENSTDPVDQSRLENLAQLQSVAQEYESRDENPTLEGFLESTALSSDTDQVPNVTDGEVTLMTLHSAKGLEYPVVFLPGFEEGTFPHSRTLNSPSELEEERRLAYVGITRARERLFITRAAERSQWGHTTDMVPSQFLDSIPQETIYWECQETPMERIRRDFYQSDGSSSAYGASTNEYGFSQSFADGSDDDLYSKPSWKRLGGKSSRGSLGSSSYTRSRSEVRTRSASQSQTQAQSQSQSRWKASDFSIGDRITHDSYGLGTVQEILDKGINSIIVVDFGTGESKRLLLRMAPIEKL